MPDLATTLTPADDDACLEQAESIVRAYCGWMIAPSAEVTVTIESLGCYELMLPSLYVTAVDSVEDSNGNAITGWRFSESGILRGAYFPAGPIAVTFTHGYAGNAVPEAVTRAVQAVAQRIKGRSGAGGVKSRQAGPFAESYGEELGASERDALAPYKIPLW